MTELKNENLDDLIKTGIHLVDFYATWCGPCKMLHPVLEEIEDKVDIITIDVDTHEELAIKYKVMSVPTLIFFKDGEKKEELIGFQTEDELLEIINNL